MCIIDRSVWSDWVFARQALEDGFISKSEFNFYVGIRKRFQKQFTSIFSAVAKTFNFLFLTIRLVLNNVLYLDVTPAECYHRIHNIRKRDFEKGISIEYLRGLDRFYHEFCDEMSKKTQVAKLDWNEYGDVDDVLKVLQKMQ